MSASDSRVDEYATVAEQRDRLRDALVEVRGNIAVLRAEVAAIDRHDSRARALELAVWWAVQVGQKTVPTADPSAVLQIADQFDTWLAGSEEAHTDLGNAS